MAQKVNPIAVRLGLNRSSESSWFSDYYYTTLFYKDLNCKHFLNSIRQPSGNKLGVRIARCVIHHYPKKSVLHLFCLTNKRIHEQNKNIHGRVAFVHGMETNIHNANLHYSYDYRIPVVRQDSKKTHKYTHLTLDALNSAFSVVSITQKEKELSEYNSERNEFRLKQTAVRDISNLKLGHKQTIYLNLIKRICNHSLSNYSHSHLNYSKQILLLKRLEEQFKEMSLTRVIKKKKKQVLFNAKKPFHECILTAVINESLKQKESMDSLDSLDSLDGLEKTAMDGLEAMLCNKNPSNCSSMEQLEEKNSHYSTFNSGKQTHKKKTAAVINSFCLYKKRLQLSMNQLYCASGWTHIMETKIREWITYNKTTETSTFEKNTLTSYPIELKANMNYLAMWYWMRLRTNTKFNCNYNVITLTAAENRHEFFGIHGVRVTLNEPSLTKSSHYHFTNIQSFLTSQTNTLTLIVPVKVSSIYQSASLVAQEICCKLEQKRAFRQICKSVFRQIDLCKYIKGIRISCSGRLNGAEIAKSECKKFGETSLHVFSDQIDYAYAKASTASGILGVKVWISYRATTLQKNKKEASP